MMDFLQGKTLLQKAEVCVSADVVLKKKILILYYFTVDDNEQCRVFDEKLLQVYEEATLRNIEMDIVTVPCDTDQELFYNNIRTNYMDWYSVQFEDDLRHILMYNFGVTHVPSLVVVRQNGELVTKTGVKDVEELGVNVLVTWRE